MGLIEILWTVTGVLVPLLLGTAWAMLGLSPPEFWIARCCVGMAALIFIGVAIIWIVMMGWPSLARVLIAAVLGALSLVGFSEAFRLINGREATLLAKSSAVVDRRAEIRAKLQEFYIEAGSLLDANIPKGIGDEEFKKYSDGADLWATNTANWIGTNLGPAARAKFLDRSSAPFLMYNAAANEKHNTIINALTAFRKNLSTLIETSAWDKS